MRFDTINFLSDYGLADEFVGVVKSVMWSIAPTARIVDITHGIKAHDVRSGGLALARSARYLNPGVVVAVVDPGVGSRRRAIAVEVGGGASILIGPDNGLLAPAVALVGGATAAVDITDSPHRLDAPGPTFDGRDLFGPVGAQLCAGATLDSVGVAIDPASLLPAVMPVSGREGIDAEVIVAEVLWIDRFGNAQLNLDPDELGAPAYSLQIGDRRRPARIAAYFDELSSGDLGLVTDASGMVALVLNRASAAAELKLSEGAKVRLFAGPDTGDASGSPDSADRAGGLDTPVTLGRSGR